MARNTLTAQAVHSIATDVGNRSMRAAGRSAWSKEDYNRAANESLLRSVQAGRITMEQAIECGYEDVK